MPYGYVLNAIVNLNKQRQEELHDYERPVAYLAFQEAEMNRDRKKQRKPYRIDDFYFYCNREKSDLPEPKYGAAALELIKRRMFPSWALFTYRDLKERAGDALPPELLCLQCDNAILLAPNVADGVVTGLLIANEKASEQVQEMHSPCGLTAEVKLPKITSKYQAIEDAELQLLRVIKKHQS